MKIKSPLSPWRFTEIRKAYKKGMLCAKCNEEVNGFYRERVGHTIFKYHLRCIGFIASRYANVDVSNFSLEEKMWLEYYNLKIMELIYNLDRLT